MVKENITNEPYGYSTQWMLKMHFLKYFDHLFGRSLTRLLILNRKIL